MCFPSPFTCVYQLLSRPLPSSGQPEALKFRIREEGHDKPTEVALHPSSANAKCVKFESSYLVYHERVRPPPPLPPAWRVKPLWALFPIQGWPRPSIFSWDRLAAGLLALFGASLVSVPSKSLMGPRVPANPETSLPKK